ncbi:endochitinase A-like [Tripterygium wilfordii]|uniref:Endochitinase A-like n=1 Tax=Tripterygium wilfordii TaxID=458696 RepID=A0A7J7DNW9_TRIWF|nr:serine/arginine repetitive matrix protein 1 [Tripterygium wilfordii]KAF5748082.1 endochitinase A-like [Tripterygium wilfordii]
MATTARESNTTHNKEKKIIFSPNSSHNSSHGHNSSSTTTTSSTRPSSMKDQNSPTINNGKSFPNYLKPTMSSRHESFKKKNNDQETTKPSLLRRRSFDRPQLVPSPSPSSRVQKALISPGPRERISRTLTVRSASFSSSKINASPKPIVDRISKTPKGTTKSMTMTPTTFSKNNFKKTSVHIPSKKEPLRKSASASSSKASTPPPETPNNNDQENKGEHEEVALVHGEDHNEEMANNVTEVVEVVPSELPNSGVDTEKLPLFNGDKEDEKKLDVIKSSEEQLTMSKIDQLPTQTHEEDGDGQCDQEETSNNTNLSLTSDETTKQLESSQEEYDDKSKEIDNPADNHDRPTKKERVDVENKLSEEGKEKVNDDGNKEIGGNGDDIGVVVIEEEVKLPNIVAPTKTPGGSNHGRKESSPAYNDVIEETASKLLEKRKNKVKALVGAFETVIDYESSSK